MSVYDLGRAVGFLDLNTDGFKKGFHSAMQDLQTFKSDTTEASDKMTAFGSIASGVGSTLTKNVTVPLVGVGATAVGVFAKFESSMSQVQATMGITADSVVDFEGKTITGAEAMEKLGAAAEEAGATTKFSASESAEALNYLALAGMSVEDSIAALPPILDLAAAGNLDLGYASDVVTDSMSALGLQMQDLPMFVDQLARTSSKANTDVSQLGEAILTVGATAKVLKGGTTELNAALGILADANAKGAEGGTRLRNIILSLSAPLDSAKQKLDELGVSAYDSDGNFKPLQQTLGELNNALSDMSAEERANYISKIFNVTDIGDVNYLLGVSAERWEELGTAIDDSTGAAEQMADIQLDNLSGQLTILKSSSEGIAISFGKLLIPYFKDFAKVLQNLLNWINGLDDTTKNLIVGFAMLFAAIGPILSIFGKFIGVIQTVIKILPILKAGFAAIGGPITLIMTLIGLLIAHFAKLYATNEEFRNKVNAVWNNVKATISHAVAAIIAKFKSLVHSVKSVGSNIVKGLWNGIVSGKDWLIGKVTGFVGGIKKVFLKGFDIHSPSKWSAWVWRMVEAGFVGEMEKSESVKKAEELSSRLMQSFSKFVDDKKFYGEMSKEDEKEFWQEVLKTKKLAAKDIEEVNKKIFTIEKEQNEEIEREQERANEEYKRNLESRTNALRGFAGLFDEIKEKEEKVSGQTLFDNLKNQIKYFKSYQRNMEKLQERGVSGPLLEELKNLGPKAADEIEALTKLSNQKLTKYQKMFEEKLKITSEQAKKDVLFKGAGSEIFETMTENIEKSEENAQKPIDKISLIFNKKIDEHKEGFVGVGTKVFNFMLEGFKISFPVLEKFLDNKIDILKNKLETLNDVLGGFNYSFAGIDGSHLNGLRRVPYDGYVAELHRGERVLTKAEADKEDRKDDDKRGGGDTFIFNSPKAIDPQEARREFIKTKRDLEGGFV